MSPQGQIERQQLFEVKKPSRSRVAEPKTDFFPFERHTRQPSRIHQSSQEEVPTNKQLKGGELFLTGDAKSRDKANINAQNFGYRKTDISNFSLRTIAEVMAKDEQTNKKAPLTQSSNERPSLLAAHSPDMPSHHTIVKQTRSPPQNQNIEFAFADTPQLMGSHTPPVINARYPFKKTDITKPGESGSLCGSKSGKVGTSLSDAMSNPSHQIESIATWLSV
ncbi:hypothetical protein BKA69DRAFT_1038345 [Paraphysoderma sedebokerense]|nr:hypothetical protein BKA69DRAFT_1038345 [Paraphysoderma sedebokerense]